MLRARLACSAFTASLRVLKRSDLTRATLAAVVHLRVPPAVGTLVDVMRRLPDGDGLTLGAPPERAQPPYIRTGLAEVAAPTRSDAVYKIRELLHDVDDAWITVLGNPDQGEPDLTLTDQDFNL